MTGIATTGAWVAGSDKPEKTSIRIGFMPLADCAPLVMASVLGFDERYGVRFELSRELSWTGMRDRLVAGDIDAAHVLYGLLYGLQMGVGTRARRMAVLMNLNQNGQGITLSRALAARAKDGATLARLLRNEMLRPTFGHTFATGNHAMFLCYWLAAAGIDPFQDCRLVTVPPGQMAASLAAGHMDGFCAGEPWGQRAVREGAGTLAVASEQIWPDHPGKVLGTCADFATANPHTCRAMVAALLEASRWLDASRANREAAAEALADPSYGFDRRSAGREVLQYCLAGRVRGAPGNGGWRGHNGLRFFGDGEASFPWLSDGMWFLTQQRRWGLLRTDPAYAAIAREVNRIDLYRDGAAQAGVAVPETPMRSSTLLDGRVWDGSDPAVYAASFDTRTESVRG